MKGPLFALMLSASCAAPQAVEPPPRLVQVPPPPPAPPPPAPVPITPDADPQLVIEGELPWWYALKSGLYKYGERALILATGRSVDHHHAIEGFVKAKVTARLSARRAASMFTFSGNLPEPELVDLFITRDRKFLALYGLPWATSPAETPPALVAPETVSQAGRHRVGRHLYQGTEHLFLECEVEGPIANPDWGRTRAAAFLYRPAPKSHP